MNTRGLEERAGTHVGRHLPGLFGARSVLAVSGGSDSVATAGLLVDGGIVARDSVIAYFDHALRGDAAAADERDAVDALASRMDMRVVAGRWGAPRPAEAAARDARYAFLHQSAVDASASFVATGHHADDQAETVLLNARRGAGLYGLRGMAPLAPLPVGGLTSDVRLVRPMLGLTREELRAYADARRLRYVHDASNEDRRFARNRLRAGVLAHAPALRASLLRLADDARRACAALDAEAAPAIVESGGCVVLDRTRCRRMPPLVASHAFRLAVERLLGNACEFDRRHYATFARALQGRTGATYELPQAIRMVVDAGSVVLGLGSSATVPVPAGFQAAVPFTGRLGAWHLDITPSRGQEATLRVPPRAVVRGRLPGDRMRLRGGSRKLQDVYVDRKVPRRDRDAAPVVAAAADVLWTPFVTSVERADGEGYSILAKRIEA